MAQTVRTLVTNSLRSINVIASGETPTDTEAEDTRVSLNEMLEVWNLESLMVYTMPREELDLTPGKGTYTLGTGGDWDIPRPIKVDSAAFHDVTANIDIPVTILTDLQFRAIPHKAATGATQYWIYFDDAYPLQNATVYPVPSVQNKILLYPWYQLTQMPNLDTQIDFPPGYAAALRYNLALWVAHEYGAPVPQTVAMLAQETKRRIKAANTRLEEMGFDPAILGSYRWNYNWRTGAIW